MKKFLALIMAAAMASTVAYGMEYSQDVKPGEVYFSENQFAFPGEGELLVTFPLVYKGTLKLDGTTADFYDGASPASFINYNDCMVYKNKPSIQMYMTMCQSRLNNVPCQSVRSNLSLAGGLKEILGANYNPEDDYVNYAYFSEGDGGSLPMITMWNLYTVVPAKDLRKIDKAMVEVFGNYREEIDELIESGRDIVVTEDMLYDLMLGNPRDSYYDMFTGSEKGEAVMFWQKESFSTSDVYKRQSGEKAMLIGKKGSLSFRYTPATYPAQYFPPEPPKDGGKYYPSIYGWFRSNESARNINIACVKSFSGNIQTYIYKTWTDSPYFEYETIGVNGTINLKLHSMTKTVAKKIFGGDTQNSILPNPTICEEGLALRNMNSMMSPLKLNAFEYNVWGKKTDKIAIIDTFGEGLLSVMTTVYFDPVGSFGIF